MNWPGCHVDNDPPAECAPRNVPNADVVVMLADGSDTVIAEGITDHDGRVSIELPPGTYLVGGREVEGLNTPEPLLLEVMPGRRLETSLHYTSGVRIDNDGHP